MKYTHSLKLLFCFVIFFGVTASYAQTMIPISPRKVVGGDEIEKANYRVRYTLKVMTDPSDTLFITEDLVTLLIGDHVQKEYSEKYYQNDSIALSALESGQFPPLVQAPLTPYVLYKNWPKSGELTMDYRLPMKAPVMTFTEHMPRLEWVLDDAEMKIAGYSCHRATTTYGGREWEVWYTPEVPLNFGPYLLNGLPGLVMKAADKTSSYRYECTSVEDLRTQDQKIVRWKWDQQKIEKQKLLSILRRLYANPDTALKSLGAKVFFQGDPMLDLPYNPINLEWK